MALILLTNDDGIDAEGLRCLEASLKGLAGILVVAPDRERSGVSHGLTVHSPLNVQELDARHFTLDGTPADCIIYTLRYLVKLPPDLVISGINRGANVGDDIIYSGTVAAAREASRYGIPSLAVSQAYHTPPVDFEEGARFIRALAEAMLQHRSPNATCLNVNIPAQKIKGVKITHQGSTFHSPHANSPERDIREGVPSRTAEYRNGLEFPPDYEAISAQYISITPLLLDQTDYEAARWLLAEAPRLFGGLRFRELG